MFYRIIKLFAILFIIAIIIFFVIPYIYLKIVSPEPLKTKESIAIYNALMEVPRDTLVPLRPYLPVDNSGNYMFLLVQPYLPPENYDFKGIKIKSDLKDPTTKFYIIEDNKVITEFIFTPNFALWGAYPNSYHNYNRPLFDLNEIFYLNNKLYTEKEVNSWQTYPEIYSKLESHFAQGEPVDLSELFSIDDEITNLLVLQSRTYVKLIENLALDNLISSPGDLEGLDDDALYKFYLIKKGEIYKVYDLFNPLLFGLDSEYVKFDEAFLVPDHRGFFILQSKGRK